jgi:hypothetical protein
MEDELKVVVSMETARESESIILEKIVDMITKVIECEDKDLEYELVEDYLGLAKEFNIAMFKAENKPKQDVLKFDMLMNKNYDIGSVGCE